MVQAECKVQGRFWRFRVVWCRPGVVWRRPGVRFKEGSGGSGVVTARCKVQVRFRRFGWSGDGQL